MDILLLAPHPYYQDRGSPIAVRKILEVLSARGDQVDVVTYHEGKDAVYDHIAIHRTPDIPFIRNIRPGFSWKKVICDLCMLVKVIRLVSRERYQVVHAVEESVYIALVVKALFGLPYVYDMDSSLAQQMVEAYPWLVPFSCILNFFEGLAVRNAKAIVPVCDALAEMIEEYNPEKVVVLQDVSLLEGGDGQLQVNLRAQLGINDLLLMYVGNLQAYQGIDLLLESFALSLRKTGSADLVIIGGEAADIRKYQEKSRHLDVQQKVHFLGPRPVEHLAAYLSQADILVSSKIKGNNTPMKIYSYLDSGRAVLATDLEAHTQLVDSRAAMLAEPSPEIFSEAMLRLIEDNTLRSVLGTAGKKLLLEKRLNQAVFRERLNGLFDWLEMEVEEVVSLPAEPRCSPEVYSDSP